jgi:putative FmdB family regulatory protein
MPEYSFICDNCDESFSLFFSINEYSKQSSKKKISCPACNSTKVNRDLLTDFSTIAGSVKKGDSELKTIGDLANRNRDRMSDDQKSELYKKHNSYRESEPTNPLPTGMTRIDTKNRKKTIWPS